MKKQTEVDLIKPNSIQLESSGDESEELKSNDEESKPLTMNVTNQSYNDYFDIPPPLEIYGF